MLDVIIHCLILWHHPRDTGKSGLDCLFFVFFGRDFLISNWDEKQPETLLVFHLSPFCLLVFLHINFDVKTVLFIYFSYLSHSECLRGNDIQNLHGFRWSVAVFWFFLLFFKLSSLWWEHLRKPSLFWDPLWTQLILFLHLDFLLLYCHSAPGVSHVT